MCICVFIIFVLRLASNSIAMKLKDGNSVDLADLTLNTASKKPRQ